MTEYFYEDPTKTWRRTDPPCTTRDAAARSFLINHPGYAAGYTAPMLTEHVRGALVDPRSVVRFWWEDEDGIIHSQQDLANARVK
jgi:hypothetical protein